MKNLAYCIVFLLLVTIGFAQDGNVIREERKIDINGDFEHDEDQDGVPDKWFTWVREGHQDEISFIYDTVDVKQGNRSIKLINIGDESSCYCLKKWLELSSSGGIVFELKGYMKASDLEAERAGICIGTLNREGKKDYEYIIIHGNGSHDWRPVQTTFAIPEDVISIDIRFLLHGKGTIWFDNFELTAKEISGDQIIHRGEKTFFKIDEDIHTEIVNKNPNKWLLLLPEDPDSLWVEKTVYTRKKAKRHLFAAPNEIKTFTWGVYSPEDKSILNFQITDLIHQERGEVIPSKNIDIRKVHYWDQRRDWHSAGYHTIPELIVPVTEDTLIGNEFGHYWTTISISDGLSAGKYLGQISVLESDQIRKVIEIELIVLPFDLIPPSKDWGLWVDSRRWERYQTNEIRKELQSIKAHGFTMLLLGMLRSRDFSIRDDQLIINLDEMDRYIQLYKDVGFREPLNLSIQHAQDQIRSLYRRQGMELDDNSFEKAYLDLLVTIKKIQKERNWPELLLLVHDEVHAKSWDVQLEAQYLYRLAKEIGFKTSVTSDFNVVKEKFIDLIDIRIFNLQVVALTDKENEQVRQDVQQRNEPFWWYGSGCYSGQEGQVLANRYLAGFFLWKSGADVQWSWTFQRPKANPYDDFDGENENPIEPKDACMTYPPKRGNGFIPTLQWEGIREGITDIKYIATLEHYIDLARHTSQIEVIRSANQAEEKLDMIKEEIPWLYGAGFTNKRADEFRSEIAKHIVSLKEMAE
jgi:hypothetical protein